MLNKNPPINPSYVLLGLILGAIGVLPKLDPTRYAKVSKRAVFKTTIKNK